MHCMYACMYLCINACMYVCMCVCIYTYIHTHMSLRIHACNNRHDANGICQYQCRQYPYRVIQCEGTAYHASRKHIHPSIHPSIHPYYAHAYIHTDRQTDTHTHTHRPLHTYTHTYVRTYIRTMYVAHIPTCILRTYKATNLPAYMHSYIPA